MIDSLLPHDVRVLVDDERVTGLENSAAHFKQWLRDKLIEKIRSLDLIQCAQLEFECVMPVADIELAAHATLYIGFGRFNDIIGLEPA